MLCLTKIQNTQVRLTLTVATNVPLLNVIYGKQMVGWKTWISRIQHLPVYSNIVALATFVLHEDI